MPERLVHMGFNNYISTARVIAVVTPSSAPIKRDIRSARDKELVIDMTNGRRIKAVVFTDSRHLVLVAIDPKTVNSRIKDGTEG